MDTLEGNKLIAEFDGLKFGTVGVVKGIHWSGLSLSFKGINWCGDKDLKYHSSWDWLMPVCKKFSDYLQKIERPSKNHCCKGDLLEVDLTCCIREYDLLGTFSNLCKCIEWYNQQQKHELSTIEEASSNI